MSKVEKFALKLEREGIKGIAKEIMIRQYLKMINNSTYQN